MVDKRVLREIIDTALSRGGDFAEVFVEQRQTTGTSCEANKVERIISGLDVGAGIRVIAGDNTAYAYTNDLSSQGLREAAEMVARAAQSSTRGAVMDFTKLKPLCDFEIEERPDEAPVEAKVELVQRANSAAREVDGRIRQVT
ncbi:MAG: TldD/PmbA family protein, partial [Clostridia bacterium]|nr:TldD/PmbA family protein [Clostridia bacterium]